MDGSQCQPVPAEHRYDYEGRCWWCGDRADSREHKWKQSEIARTFGRGSYGTSVVWLTDDPIGTSRTESIRGPKATRLKFSATLCAPCNNARSQPFDRAYDLFAEYVTKKYGLLIDQGWVDLREVYGRETRTQIKNLARYYGKHIGCRVAERAGKVPADLIHFMDGVQDQAHCVYSEFGIREHLLPAFHEGQPVLNMRGSVARYHEPPAVGLRTFKSAIGIAPGPMEFLYDISLDPAQANTGHGILQSPYQPLPLHGEDLFKVNFQRPRTRRRPWWPKIHRSRPDR